MRRSRQNKQKFAQRRQDEGNYIVKPLNEESHGKQLPKFGNHENGIERSPTSSISSLKTLNEGNLKWVSKNRSTHVEKSDLGVKFDMGGSSYSEKEGGYEVNERESERGERSCRDEVKLVVGGKKIEGEGAGSVDDVIRRLEELHFGVNEIELSKEQIEINDQCQEDELLAMESIYEDNVYFLEKQRGMRSFQIYIHIELPSEYPVSAKLDGQSNTDFKSENSEDFLYTFKVQYLSPIILSCLLPRSYPSHSPPSFTISARWLHKSKISELCSVLDSMWNEQPGQEILFQWVDWLHNSSLSHLGFGEKLMLGPYDVKSSLDRRVLSGIVSPDVDIPSMKSYNEATQREHFVSNSHECCICFSEYAGTEFLTLPCHHFFCVKCMKTYADMHVTEGTVNKLQCPTTKCGGMFPPGLLKRLLGEEEFERWESLMLQKTLESMADIAYCPRCETACLEDESQHAICTKCFFSFCTFCRERRHVGVACMTPELKLKFLEERQNSSLLRGKQRQKELDMINEIRSVKEILSNSKQCPSCKMAISRTEGCNKMVCGQCGQYFCYLCSKAISGYEHFRGDGACQLFPEEAIIRWEAQIIDPRVLGQNVAQVFAGNAQPCPNCRQMNAKVGNNNHMFCWACQTHYCYLCRQVVRRSKLHYSPNGCKQHTVG
ncbi:uncharacterized protein LOC130800772 [Amaranthus tricolor]|uniref:uncharacterized protein LOC130800772 n=1 Tax=Amaranthus tricolor TaxID=29722 RepID=UPI00258411B2|nr:uncharacterized protein LOC130800772 [Amaranthus tricolor]